MAASGDTAIGESGQSRLQIPVDKGQRSTGKPLRTPPRHTFRRAGRLDENAEPSRTKVRRDSRTMRAFMLALLCGRRAKAYPINYLAIAKTGSTSLNIAIKEAQAAGHQCDDIKVRFHHFTALRLRRQQKDFRKIATSRRGCITRISRFGARTAAIRVKRISNLGVP